MAVLKDIDGLIEIGLVRPWYCCAADYEIPMGDNYAPNAQ